MKHGFRMVERINCIQRLPSFWWSLLLPLWLSLTDISTLSGRTSKKHHSRWLKFQVTLQIQGFTFLSAGIILCRKHTWFILVVLLFNIPHTLDLSLGIEHCEISSMCNREPLYHKETVPLVCSNPEGDGRQEVIFWKRSVIWPAWKSWWKEIQEPPFTGFWLWLYISMLLVHLVERYFPSQQELHLLN